MAEEVEVAKEAEVEAEVEAEAEAKAAEAAEVVEEAAEVAITPQGHLSNLIRSWCPSKTTAEEEEAFSVESSAGDKTRTAKETTTWLFKKLLLLSVGTGDFLSDSDFQSLET